jgi:hypothetical protein
VVAWKAAILNQARLPPPCLKMTVFLNFLGNSRGSLLTTSAAVKRHGDCQVRADRYEGFPYWMGVWQFSGDAWGAISYEQAKAVVAKAVDVGIYFFNTVAVYGRGGARSTSAGP